jgi:sporulation protein YlmC with PRC-barrel domain
MMATDAKENLIIAAATLMGNKVHNAAGENLGKIEEIMIDVDGGRVAYAVLSFGGFLGIGDKLFAVPWDALALAPSGKEFILDVGKEVLDNAPGFDRNNWPNMADESWHTQIHSHWT